MLNKILFIVLLLLPLAATAASFNIYTENFGRSSYYEDGELHGFGVDIVREIQKRVGNKSNIEMLPWVRAYMYLKTRKNTVLFQTALTKERKNYFKWVGPISVIRWGFYARKDSKLKINSLEDAKKVSLIGTCKDDAKEQYLKSKGFKNLKSIHSGDAYHQNIVNLKRGAVDLIIMSEEAMIRESEKLGFEMNDFKMIYEIDRNYLYIAFSRDVSSKIVNKWQKALNSMKKDGTYTRIMRKYPGADKLITFAKPGTM